MSMPTMLKYILVSAGSMVAGAIGGYFYARKQLETSYDAELREAIDKECETLRKAHDDAVTSSKTSPSSESETAQKTVIDVMRDYGGTAPEGMALEEDDEEEGFDPEVLPESEAQQVAIYARDHGNDPPEEVGPVEFGSLYFPYYQPVDFEYYTRDHVLLDEEGSIVDNPDTYVGDILDDVTDVPTGRFVYIRNGRLGLAISILIRNEWYYEENEREESQDESEED